MGGEKLRFPALLARELGSPPRGRGKAVHRFPGLALVGITPAWAGKSASLDFFGFLLGDHPRVGGEKPYATSRVI